MAVTLIFRDSKPHRPTIAVASVREEDTGSRRSFVVANLSGQYLTDKDARDLALEKADKAGFQAQDVVTRDMATHNTINED